MNEFLSTVENVNGTINGFVWGAFGLILLIGTGVVITAMTKCFQLSHIGLWFKNTLGSLFKRDVIKHSKEKGSISPFQALCTALAATVGTGNIAGVAAAITIGGAGAVFWMWVAAFFGMMTNYAENVLGIYYRRRNKKGEWSGGAMYYLRDGVGKKKGMKYVGKVLAILFCIFTMLASFGIGSMGQVNKIVTNVTQAFDVPALSSVVLYTSEVPADETASADAPADEAASAQAAADAAVSDTAVSGDMPAEGETVTEETEKKETKVTLYNLIIGLVIMALTALITLGGVKRIANVAEKIVPVMVLLFVLGSLVVIGVNYESIFPAFGAIFRGAFCPESFVGGGVGFVLAEVITQGFKRGVFSNEAGLGSSVMVHSNSNIKEPVKQGMWGIFEVFADTIVICTMTALVILTAGGLDGGVFNAVTGEIAAGYSDATLVGGAFNSVFSWGGIGEKFIAVAMFLFAFTTVLGWSHYGSKAWEYLFGEKTTVAFRVIHVITVVFGALLTSSLAWDISDTFNGLMMIPNLIGVLVLSPLVIKITKNYLRRKNKLKERVDWVKWD